MIPGFSMNNSYKTSLLELIKVTSSSIPEDAQNVLINARQNEQKGSNADYALKVIEDNIKLAKKNLMPVCQDTGTLHFYLKHPEGFKQNIFKEAIHDAVEEATEKGYLRKNSVDSLTSVNDGTNLGPGHPDIHFIEHNKENLEVSLILKGGGCENVGIQYSLPNKDLDAGRDLDGVKKVILDAVYKAQGLGCAPGILGVCIGGDRSSGYLHSKKQFLRRLDDQNENPDLDKLENEIVEEANKLGIGPMGFGGKTTLLGCKIGVLNRLPASYFVSISYMCWAYRRQGIELTPEGKIKRWQY